MTSEENDIQQTLGAVAFAISEIRTAIKASFERVETRMDVEFTEFNGRLEKAERQARLTVNGLDNLRERTEDIHRRTVNLEHRVEDIRDTLDGFAAAEEKDMKATMNHGKRISRLEDRAGIKPAPPRHLAKS